MCQFGFCEVVLAASIFGCLIVAGYVCSGAYVAWWWVGLHLDLVVLARLGGLSGCA